ncbi:MAG: hypothetical protein M1337_00685 [Actinobacteria bacterium]|nr:hypothetical protein [Actinomycetota bacterium]
MKVQKIASEPYKTEGRIEPIGEPMDAGFWRTAVLREHADYSWRENAETHEPTDCVVSLIGLPWWRDVYYLVPRSILDSMVFDLA